MWQHSVIASLRENYKSSRLTESPKFHLLVCEVNQWIPVMENGELLIYRNLFVILYCVSQQSSVDTY